MNKCKKCGYAFITDDPFEDICKWCKEKMLL